MRFPFSPARHGLAAYALVALTLAGLTLSACASLPPAPVARIAKAPQAYETAKAFDAPVSPRHWKLTWLPQLPLKPM